MPTIVQSITGSAPTLTMPGAITSGRTLVYVGATRGAGLVAPTGYTVSPNGITAPPGDNDVGIFTKTAGASESTTLTMAGNGDQKGYWLELDGQYQVTQYNSGSGSSSNTPNTGTVTVTAGTLLLAAASDGTDGGWGPQTFTPPAGWTEVLDERFADTPSVWFAYRMVASAGTYDAQPVCTAAGRWTAQIVSFAPAAAPGFWIDFDRD